jgi:hypothetical protein
MATTKRKSRRKSKPKPLGTIWEVPDALWEKVGVHGAEQFIQ